MAREPWPPAAAADPPDAGIAAIRTAVLGIGRSVDATGSYRMALACLGVLPAAAASAWVLLGRRKTADAAPT
jgi:hypothetical protein